VASVVAMLLATAITERQPLPRHLDVLAFVAGFGAVCGIIAAPAGGWLLLRHVPLGRAMLWSVLGTVVGAVVAWTVPLGRDQIGRAVLGAVLGFIIAALLVRSTTPRVRPAHNPSTPLQS
jgi:drug/metabolite transporter superfamily protein YnfA